MEYTVSFLKRKQVIKSLEKLLSNEKGLVVSAFVSVLKSIQKQLLLLTIILVIPMVVFSQRSEEEKSHKFWQPFVSLGTGISNVSQSYFPFVKNASLPFNTGIGIRLVPKGKIYSFQTGVLLNSFSNDEYGRVNILSIPFSLRVNYIARPKYKFYLGVGLAVNYLNEIAEIDNGVRSSLHYFTGGDFIRFEKMALGVELRNYYVNLIEAGFKTPAIGASTFRLALVLRFNN